MFGWLHCKIQNLDVKWLNLDTFEYWLHPKWDEWFKQKPLCISNAMHNSNPDALEKLHLR